MAADSNLGVINLETKEVLHEYHFYKHMKHGNFSSYDMSWGNKMVQTKDSKFMVLPNCLILPYNLLSYIQNYQTEAHDDEIQNFFVNDYYKINGQTLMHKFIHKPVLLEKLMEDYWKQNKNFLTSVLVKKEEMTKKFDDKQ